MPVEVNRWIVCAHKYVEHYSPDEAEAERVRLSEKHPQKRFRLYRIKRELIPLTAEEEAMMDELASYTAEPLMVDENEAGTAEPLSESTDEKAGT